MLVDGFKYKQWADRRTLDAAKALEERDAEAATAFIRQQLNHMVIVEELFRARLSGVALPHGATNTDMLPALNDVDLRLMASNQWFGQYVAAATAGQLDEQLPLQFVDGKAGRMSRREILFHVINHGTYHRGAIGHALDLAKGARPADTFTVFIHAAEPGRRQ